MATNKTKTIKLVTIIIHWKIRFNVKSFNLLKRAEATSEWSQWVELNRVYRKREQTEFETTPNSPRHKQEGKAIKSQTETIYYRYIFRVRRKVIIKIQQNVHHISFC